MARQSERRMQTTAELCFALRLRWQTLLLDDSPKTRQSSPLGVLANHPISFGS